MTTRVLLVDDDREVREALGQSLELANLSPILAGSFIEAKDHMTPAFDGVIVTDLRMPGRDGFHLLEHAQQIDPELPVILLTGQGDVPTAVRAMADGAHGFLEKPCAPAELVAAVRRALELRRAVLEKRQAKHKQESGDAASRMLIGTSALAQDLREQVRRVARAQADVLVMGETGAGTPKVAEVIHLLSGAARNPFVKCTAATLSPSELDAAFQQAAQGTVFVDDIGALPQTVQFALIRWFDRADRPHVIVGAPHDLEAQIDAGRISADVLARLDLMRVHIPPIRERTQDIPDLFRHYVALACEQANLPHPHVTPAVIAGLMAQDWPGNARALMNAAMRFSLGLSQDHASTDLGLAAQMAQIEKSLLIAALRREQGHATETARRLKLPRKTFYDKLSRHGLRADDYRHDD
jgi:two-component system C4-dicarboxylate transport response regulator DctD